MALLTLQTMLESGVARNAALANCSSGGDSCPNDGRTFLLVQNGGGSSQTVTVTAQRTSAVVSGFGNVTLSNIAVAVAASDEVMIGAFPPGVYNDGNGNLAITYSAVTSMKIAAVRMPRVDT